MGQTYSTSTMSSDLVPQLIELGLGLGHGTVGESAADTGRCASANLAS